MKFIDEQDFFTWFKNGAVIKVVQEYDTVVFHSIRQSRVTGPQKSTKCHDGHGHFGEVTKSFLDSKKKI